MKDEKLKEFMTPDEMQRLSRDYVLEHEGITILSSDDVIENGREWNEKIWYDRYGYRLCDLSGGEEIPITGLFYERFNNGRLSWYGYYEDGFENGVHVTFYPSGQIRSYRRDLDEGEKEIYYKWYEDGMIKWIPANREGYVYIEIARNGKLRWLTALDLYAWRGDEPVPEHP
ncbi:MAG: hypothetical protein K6E36_09490 [Oscillospiraceae bacterium]|nr:hypothetical protein [Oscillospiraceae bacterium]